MFFPMHQNHYFSNHEKKKKIQSATQLKKVLGTSKDFTGEKKKHVNCQIDGS